MSNPSTGASAVREEVAELFCIQLEADAVRGFLGRSDAIHRHLQAFEGYNGLEILLLSSTELQVLIRWRDLPLFERYLPQILHSCLIKDWLTGARHSTCQPTISTTYLAASAEDGKCLPKPG